VYFERGRERNSWKREGEERSHQIEGDGEKRTGRNGMTKKRKKSFWKGQDLRKKKLK